MDQTNSVGTPKKKTSMTAKVVLGIFLFIVGIALMNSYNDLNGTLDENKDQLEKSKEKLDGYQAIVDAGSEESNTYEIGEAAKLGNAIVTVNQTTKSQGGAYSKPASGNEWVNLNITIENTGSSEEYVTTLGQMFLRDGEGNSYQVAVTDKSMESVNNSLDGTVIAKSKRTGWVGFEVKKGVTGLQFQYNGSMWGGKNAIFNLAK